MPETGAVRPIQVQPNRNVLQPGELGTRAQFALRAQAPPQGVQFPGGPSNMAFVMAPLQVQLNRTTVRPGGRGVVFATTPLAYIQASGLVHTRALGALAVSPQLRLTALVHTRAIGSGPVLVVSPVVPPVTPPPTDPTLHSTLSGGPRSIKSVRRRDIRDRR